MRVRFLALILAAGIACPHPAAAAPPAGKVGATSTASLRISVSVRPRIVVRRFPGSGAGQGFCFFSTGGEQRFAVTLSAPERTDTALIVSARPLAPGCSIDRAQVRLDLAKASLGQALLLIAPQ